MPTPLSRLLAPAAVVLALAACRDDSPRMPTQPVSPGLLASRHAAEDDGPPQFSAWSAPVNLGPPVNTASVEQGASISKDGLSLYFHCTGCPENAGGADIWVAHRAAVTDPWSAPQRLGPNVNTTDNETAPTLSADGHQLFFARDGATGFGGTDLYVSRRRDKHDDLGWEPAVNLGSGINTAANEAQATLFEDEETETTTLYFSSNRAGGPGLDDIYSSTLQRDGTFGPAALVPELSTTSNDRQPAIRRDGLEMFLGSDRTGTLGAIDLWVSTRATTRDPWSPPVNLGPVVNSALIDARPALSFDGTTLYFQSTRPGAVGCTSTTGSCVFDLWVTTRTRLHRTVLVDANRSGDGIALTIQDGIRMVASAGKVRVVPGTYHENVVVDKGLTLEAVGGESGQVIVDPVGTPFATIEIRTGDPVTIRGLTVHARHSGISGISGLAEDLTVERTTVLATDPLTFAFLIDVVGDEPTTRRARLVARENVLDGSISFERSQAPPVPQVFGIRAGGDIDAWIEGNVIRRTGGACIIVQTREDFGGGLDGHLVRNDLDECYAARAGALIVGPPIPQNPPLAVTATGTVNIVGNTIRNSRGSCRVASGIYYELYTGQIAHNRIEGVVQECAAASDRVLPSGIWVGSRRGVSAATPVVRFNDIVGNAHAGLHVASNITTALDARCNWWGSASGPSGVGPGSGDAIVVEAGAATPVFTPFSTEPVAERRQHSGDACLRDDDDGSR